MSGTVILFLDVSFGVAPVVLGLVANRAGYEPTFILSAVLAAVGACLLVVRRRSLERTPVPAVGEPALPRCLWCDRGGGAQAAETIMSRTALGPRTWAARRAHRVPVATGLEPPDSTLTPH